MLVSKAVSFFLACVLSLSTYAEKYIIGTEDINYYPHYGKVNVENPIFSGYAKDIFDHFSRAEKIHLDYKYYPVKRLYKAFRVDNLVDFKYPDNPKWRSTFIQDQPIYYSAPVGTFIDGTVVLEKNKQYTINNVKRLGTIKGFTLLVYAQQIKNKQIQLFEYSNTDKLLKALSHQLIDAAYLNIDVATHQMLTNKTPIHFVRTLPYSPGYYHLSTIKHREMIDKLNNFLDKNAILIESLQRKYRLTTH